MKAKKSPGEIFEIIIEKIEYLKWNIRELERHLNFIGDVATDNSVYVKQLDELIGDLLQIELGK